MKFVELDLSNGRRVCRKGWSRETLFWYVENGIIKNNNNDLEILYINNKEDDWEYYQEAKNITEWAASQLLQQEPTIIPEQQDKNEGFYHKKVWKFEIINEGLISRTYWMVDEDKIKAIVKSLGKEAESVVGGIRVYQETQLDGIIARWEKYYS